MECNKCFSVKFGHHFGADMLYTVDEPDKKAYSNIFHLVNSFRVTISINKIVNGVQCVCAQIVALLHTETFVTFDFDPSLISRVKPDSNSDRIK